MSVNLLMLSTICHQIISNEFHVFLIKVSFSRQVVMYTVCHHKSATIMVVWHCICVGQGPTQHLCKALHHTFMATRLSFSSLRWVKVSFSHRLSENLVTSSGGMPSCGCYNSGCLALYMCITSP